MFCGKCNEICSCFPERRVYVTIQYTTNISIENGMSQS